MRQTSKTFLSVLGLTVGIPLGCGDGTSDRQRDLQAGSSFVASESQQHEALAASFDESLESLGDSHLGGGDLALSMAMNDSLDASPKSSSGRGGGALGFGTRNYQGTKSCSVSEGSAVIALKGSHSFSFERTKNNGTVLSASASQSHDISRTWSKPGETLACDAAGKNVVLPSDGEMTGFQLAVAVKRESARSRKVANAPNGKNFETSAQMAVTGERTVTWVSQTTNADGSLSIEKMITMAIERNGSMRAKDGSVKQIAMKMETLSDRPLVVSSTAASRGLYRWAARETIKSGALRVTAADGSYMEASYNMIAFSYSRAGCQVQSGSMSAQFYAGPGQASSKTYELSAENGSVTVLDVTDPARPFEVEDFDYSPCDVNIFR